jgi:hypothetical protein
MEITKKYTSEELKHIPDLVIEAMLDEQEKQGNPRNLQVFEERIYAGKDSGGFDWNETENESAWEYAINEGEYDALIKAIKKPIVHTFPKRMLVSDDNENWYDRIVHTKVEELYFVSCSSKSMLVGYEYAKELPTRNLTIDEAKKIISELYEYKGVIINIK